MGSKYIDKYSVSIKGRTSRVLWNPNMYIWFLSLCGILWYQIEKQIRFLFTHPVLAVRNTIHIQTDSPNLPTLTKIKFSDTMKSSHSWHYWRSLDSSVLYNSEIFFFFLVHTVRIWEFSPVWTDFDKCHNLSKRDVKLILKTLSDLEPLRGSSNKKKVVFKSFLCKLGFFGTRGPLKRSFHSRFKLAHSC
jgi:hypothetical protein